MIYNINIYIKILTVYEIFKKFKRILSKNYKILLLTNK